MKQICTQIAFFCLLFIGQNVYAQTSSVTITKINPGPTPGYGAADSVKAENGFSSTNTGTFHDFAPFQTDTIISSWYYYPTTQTSINFVFSTSSANSGVDATPTVLIITENGDTLSASASQNFKGASTDYYFTFNLGTTLPANTNFKIAVIMDLGPKAISANTFAINALKGTAPAPASLPLPVTFAGFYAKNNNGYISLTWNVATESNVTGYEVQRSIDGANFSKIGFVSAANNSSYSFIDSKAGDIVYYRIKSIDADGKYSYSIIVNIKGLQSDVVMRAFPMPVQNQLTIQHNAANGNTKLEIISADGRIIKALFLTEGTQQTNVDIASAKPGVYVVRLLNGTNIQTAKIIKQ
jgi:hypothetical protein